MLARANQSEVVSLKLEEPTRIKCVRDVMFSRKPFFLDYTPHENARYQIVDSRAGQRFVEVDVFDSDN